uniref:GDSL esterase/lipase At1g54790 isoform X3 n=1 Tax=Rhizophora mucronata TaxID=61149 RepID=A0A2P2JXJ2_RHIMU
MSWNRMRQQDHSGLYRTCIALYQNNPLLGGTGQVFHLQQFEKPLKSSYSSTASFLPLHFPIKHVLPYFSKKVINSLSSILSLVYTFG